MYITKRTSYIVAFLVVLSFFIVGGLFLRSPDRERTRTPSIETPAPLEAESLAGATLQEDTLPTPSSTEQTESSQADSREDTPVTTPSSSISEGFALENFHRSETRDGKLLWEIVGLNARYQPNNSQVDIEKCVFIMTDKRDKKVTLKASKANIFLDGPELRSAAFSGDVTLFYDDEMKVMAPEATYIHSLGQVTSASHVKVIGKWFTIEGDGLEANLDNKRYQILSNVTSILEPGKRRS